MADLAKMAAMPSGRLAGRPLADGLAPVDGSDRIGLTRDSDERLCELREIFETSGIGVLNEVP